MFEILGFYFGIVSKVFNVYLSYEIFPGVSYLAFMSAFIIMTFLLSFIFHNIKEEYDYKYTKYKQDKWDSEYKETYARKGKHAFVSRHTYKEKHGPYVGRHSKD